MESSVNLDPDATKNKTASKQNTLELCRLCANTDNQLIPIFEGEGLEHDIPVKLEKHLPIIEVTQSDELPSQICYQCASTLLAWHNLYEGCSLADKRLREILAIETEKKDEISVGCEDDFRDDAGCEENGCLESGASVMECNETSNGNATEVEPVEISNDDFKTESTNIDRLFQQKFDSANCFYERTDLNIIGTTQMMIEHNIMTLSNYEVLNEFLVCQNDNVSSVGGDGDVCPCVWSNNDCSKCGRFESLTCDFCAMVFLEVKMRNRHLRITHAPELLNYCMNWLMSSTQSVENFPESDEQVQNGCDSCSHTLGEEVDLSDHRCNRNSTKQMIHESIDQISKISTLEYQCEHCLVLVPTKRDMRKHLLTFHPVNRPTSISLENNKLIYSCSTCGQIFLKKNAFTRHLNSHATSRHECNQCKRTFTSEYALITHQNREHRDTSKNIILLNGKKYMKCERCAFMCKNERNKMLEHLRVHTGEKPFTCEECGKQFRTKALFRVHKRFVHESVKEFPCDFCGRHFSSKRYVEEHRRIHTGEKPLICDLCGKTFRQKASLSKHFENHLGIKQHACYLCYKRFANSYHLSRHVKRHLGVRNCTCEHCGKKFVDLHELKMHKVVHSDVRPYICRMCGAAFKLQKHLKQHEKTHSVCEDL